jgi:hypothetical protein
MKEDRTNPYRWIAGFQIESEYPLGSQMKISDESTCEPAGAEDFCIGTLYSYPNDGIPGRAGVSVDGEFNHRGTGIAAEAITAGDRIKVGAPDGTIQRYAKFVPGTDEPGIWRGVAITSAASAGDTFEALFK